MFPARAYKIPPPPPPPVVRQHSRSAGRRIAHRASAPRSGTIIPAPDAAQHADVIGADAQVAASPVRQQPAHERVEQRKRRDVLFVQAPRLVLEGTYVAVSLQSVAGDDRPQLVLRVWSGGIFLPRKVDLGGNDSSASLGLGLRSCLLVRGRNLVRTSTGREWRQSLQERLRSRTR
jgi:hypothetical protein